MDATHVTAINNIAEFLANAQIKSLFKQSPVDVIVLCGNSILPIAEHVFSALESNPNLARYLVICGGIGHSTEYLYQSVAAHPVYRSLSNSINGLPEARVLQQILEKFHNSKVITRSGLQIIIEDRSTNCGANAIETRLVLDAHGVTGPRSIVVVQDPTMSLRTLAAFEKVYGDKNSLPVMRTCPTFIPVVRLTADGNLDYDVADLEGPNLWTTPRFLDLLMGELPRLRDDEKGYGPRGKNFISHVDIPQHIEQAFAVLQGGVENRR